MVCTDFQIRKARTDDLGALPTIEAAAAKLFATVGLENVPDDPTSAEDFSACQEEGLLWVAVREDDAPVGFAFVEMIGGLAHLDELDVHPDYGRRGVGAALVETVLRWAATADIAAVTLTTFRDVPWNMPFYARLGFAVLAASQLTPELRELVAAEARRGLPPEIRVVMRCDLRKRDYPSEWSAGSTLVH